MGEQSNQSEIIDNKILEKSIFEFSGIYCCDNHSVNSAGGYQSSDVIPTIPSIPWYSGLRNGFTIGLRWCNRKYCGIHGMSGMSRMGFIDDVIPTIPSIPWY